MVNIIESPFFIFKPTDVRWDLNLWMETRKEMDSSKWKMLAMESKTYLVFAFLRGSHSKGHWLNSIKVELSRSCFQVFFQLFDQKGLLLVWIQSREENVQSQQRMRTNRGESRRFLVLQKRIDQLDQQVRPHQACSTNTTEPISEKLGPFWAELDTANTS